MRVIMMAAAIAALAFASTAEATSCKDAKGHFIKCPAPAAAPANKPAAKSTMSKTKAGTTFVAGKTPAFRKCKTGVPCGNSCIPKGKVCHK
jgi:hypothetical protein